MQRLLLLSCAVALAGLSAACTSDSRGAPGGGRRIAIAVTDQGFVPASVTVASGKPVTLVVTRRTDATCATELVVKAYGINRPLPLGRPVEVTFTPERPETLRYACAMDMVAGTMVVR
jgi:plastocyanin domain-containing protein